MTTPGGTDATVVFRRSPYRRATRLLNHAIEEMPSVFPRYRAWRGTSYTPLTDRSALVICAPEGCGNSYLREALLHANPGLEVASHAHSWTTAANATKRGLPLVILVRDGVDAVASRLARFVGSTSPRWALEDHARFYEHSRRFLDTAVIASFTAATTRPGLITSAVNARFGTTFAAFDDASTSARDEVLGVMNALSDRTFGTAAAASGAAPSSARTDAKATIIAELRSPSFARLLARTQSAVAPFSAAAERLDASA